MNVDGFDYKGPLAVHPEFIAMVERLQVGGVIPHYGSTDPRKIQGTNRALAGLTRLPLLVCSDILKLKGPASGGAGTGTASFGDGYVGGFIGRYRGLPEESFRALCELNAFTFAALGVNTALGPTVDNSTADPRTAARARIIIDALRRFGIEPVLKHYPFLPLDRNLHRESPDTALPPEEAARRSGVFHELAGESGILMTTHLFDSLVDGKSIVTFSTAWHKRLLVETGFSGLVMSDGLLMLRNYADRRVLGDEQARGSSRAGALGGPGNCLADKAADWALRAILAGHDMVIVEGSAAITYGVFTGLLSAACAGTDTGAHLRRRIEESYRRIERFKDARREELSRHIEVPIQDIRAAVSLVSGSAEPSSFRIDPEALSALQPVFQRTAVR